MTLDRSQAPEIKDAVSFSYHLPDCSTTVFPNGLPLYWLNAGTQDVAKVEWVFKAGLWQEQQTGVAQAVAALLKNGTEKHSALALNEAIEYYGGSLSVAATNDFHTVTLFALTKHLPVLLPVVREILLEACFPQDEVEIYRQNAVQRLHIHLEKTDFVANRTIDALLFGGRHPYGRRTEREDLLSIDSALLRAFHREHFTSSNCRMFLSGNIGLAEVRLLEEAFGMDAWGSFEPIDFKRFDPAPVSGRIHRLQIGEQPNVQASIRLSAPFLLRNHPDFLPMVLVNMIFGGYFGSRLMANIREEKGYTYGIYSGIYSYKEGAAWMVSSEVGAQVAEKAVAEVYAEMRRMRDERMAEEELLLVKNYLLGGILSELDGPFSIMQRWKNMVLFDLPKDSFDETIRVFKNLDARQVEALSNQYLTDERFCELIVT